MPAPAIGILLAAGRFGLKWGDDAIKAATKFFRSGSSNALKGTREVGETLAKTGAGAEDATLGTKYATRMMQLTGGTIGLTALEWKTQAVSSMAGHLISTVVQHHPDITEEDAVNFLSTTTDIMNTWENGLFNMSSTALEDIGHKDLAIATNLAGVLYSDKADFTFKLYQQDQGERSEFAADYLVEKSGVSRDELVEMLEAKPGNREMLENMLDSKGIDLDARDIFPELTELQNIPGYNKDKLKNHFETARNGAEGFSLTSAFQSSAWDGFAETMDHIWDVLRNLIGMVFLGGIAKLAQGLTGENFLQDTFRASVENKEPEQHAPADDTERDGPTHQPPTPGAPGPTG